MSFLGRIRSRIGIHHADLRECAPNKIKQKLEDVLKLISATPCGQSGTPDSSVNVEFYEVGGQGFRLVRDDAALTIKIWGSKNIVEDLSRKLNESNT